MSIKIPVEHGILYRAPNNRFGYFGWPTITKLDDGRLIVVCSGFRMHHVCPFGKTVMFIGYENGKKWSPPIVINDTPLDDRDAGILNIGNNKLMLNFFNFCFEGEDKEYYYSFLKERLSESDYSIVKIVTGSYTLKTLQDCGSFVRLSCDGGITWEEASRVPVSSPHGPALLNDGSLIYLGKIFGTVTPALPIDSNVAAYKSSDEGRTWELTGMVPLAPNTTLRNFHEPHAIELPSGRILGMLRFQDADNTTPYGFFTVFKTVSDDKGKTWSIPEPLGVEGSPPHLMRHSSGTIVCSYGRRIFPYGERAAISTDNGETWLKEIELFSDVPDDDLGYPSSVELDDRSIFTVYYQKYAEGEKNSILWTHWQLPL